MDRESQHALLYQDRTFVEGQILLRLQWVIVAILYFEMFQQPAGGKKTPAEIEIRNKTRRFVLTFPLF